MNKFGYLGVMLLIAIENIFPPIPSEVILTFGGFMTKQPNSSITILGVIIASTIGSMVGALVLYYIGKILNKERLQKIVSGKVGKVLRVKPKDIESADKWFDAKGNKTVFFCRFIPIVRSLISIPAGMSEMPMPKFLLYTVIGSAIWNTVLVVIGSVVGKNWEKVVEIIDKYSKVVLILLVVAFILAIIIFYKKRRKNK
jgi:membrane protein DedA with SNARE-associated domain